MAQTPFQRALAELADIRELTQQRAERLVRDLVRSGEVQTEHAQSMVTELIDRSRKNRERLANEIERIVREQVAKLRVANQADLARLEKRIAALERTQKRAGAKKSSSKKAPAAKAAKSASAGGYAPARGSRSAGGSSGTTA
jgi:polyhydroxyalkanoate synthesis regulator phasin